MSEVIVIIDHTLDVARIYLYEGARPAYVSLDKVGNEVGALCEQGHTITIRRIGRPEPAIDTTELAWIGGDPYEY